MANYFEMNRDELVAEKAKLEEQYKKFQAMGHAVMDSCRAFQLSAV